MANYEELTDSALEPAGEQWDYFGRGDRQDVWGGRTARRDDSGYTGGWHEGPSGIRSPNDMAAYNAAVVYRPSGRQEDVDRYRNLGSDMADREAQTIDYNQANAALGWGIADRARADNVGRQQNEVNATMRSAALGSAPSRAEILGGNLLNQTMQQQQAAASSAKGGPLAQAAAMKNAQAGAQNFASQGMNNLAALRSDEMERARQQWGQQLYNQRAQDYGAADQAGRFGAQYAQMAQSQADINQQQRALNQQAQMGYEGMAFDVNNASLQAGLGRQQMQQGQSQFNRQVEQQEADRTQRNVAAATGAGAAFGGSLLDYAGRTQSSSGGKKDPYSDMRTKVPLLIAGGRQPKAAAPSFLAQYMADEQDRQHKEHTSRMEDAGAMVDGEGLERDDPYSAGTPGGIQREDPYGSGQYFFSDPAAKRAAFEDGVRHTEEAIFRQGGDESDLPEYMKGRGPGISRETQRVEPVPSSPRWGDRTEPRQAVTEPRVDTVVRTHGAESNQKDPRLGGEAPFTRVTQGPDYQKMSPRVSRYARDLPASPTAPAENSEQGAPVGWTPTRAVERGGPVKGAPVPNTKGKPSPFADPGGPLSSMQQDANRAGAGLAYAYKDQYRPPEQAPGELNWGPSADEMVKSPLMATAVKVDPSTGMKAIDTNKLLKNNTAGIASLQQQIDELRGSYG